MPRVSQQFRALAVDYDDTLATGGRVEPAVFEALHRLKASGLGLLLVTGRELDDLRRVFPALPIFDRVVAENGGVLHRPETGDVRALCGAPSLRFLDLLRARNVVPLSVGQVIVSTREPQEVRVLEAIRELGLELEIIFNKGAVMILPSGVNKATGLRHALAELKLQAARVVAMGDAENDHAFLEACGYGVAVANAIPALKEHANLVTSGGAGVGVIEVVERLLSDGFGLPPSPSNLSP
jgi:hydroxymethylpyrimidine pyrophosphatase-like HAD family hydrolase